MDPAYFDYLLIASGALVASTLGFAIAWIRSRERAIRAEQAPERFAAGAEARLDRLEQIAESTALDLERILEAQRFQSKLMAARASELGASPARSQIAPGHVNTPH